MQYDDDTSPRVFLEITEADRPAENVKLPSKEVQAAILELAQTYPNQPARIEATLRHKRQDLPTPTIPQVRAVLQRGC